MANPNKPRIYRRLPRWDYPGYGYFLNICTIDRRPIFNDPALAEAMLGLYVARRDKGKFLLHGYVIMPDHYHVIISPRNQPSISGIVRKIHSDFDRDYLAPLGFPKRLWQRRFFDHLIRDKEDFLTRLNYCHNNPAEAELVEDILDWPWSSARFWETGSGSVRCDGWE